MKYTKKLFIQMLFFIVLVACLASLGGCARDPQGLRTPRYERDIVADIIKQAEYNAQQTTVKVVSREKALDLLNGGY